MDNAIEFWARLVEKNQIDEDGTTDFLCFFDGIWHDGAGNPIDIPENDEQKIVQTISRMESMNYSSVPSLIMMDDVETLEDISDYLECEMEDMFLFFRKPDSMISEFSSPSSKNPHLQGGLYLLASLQKEDGLGVTWSEIADICGEIKNIGVFSRLLSFYFDWIRNHGVQIAACSCREATSDRFFKSRLFLKKFDENGYALMDGITSSENNDGERFNTNILVDKEWFDKLDSRDRSRLINTITDLL